MFTSVSSVGENGFYALIAYTTSQPWRHEALPPGVFVIDQSIAASFGQGRAFVLDLRRLAFVPLTALWFPRLGRPDRGVQGRAALQWQRRFKQVADDLLSRRAEIIERLGPSWPGRR